MSRVDLWRVVTHTIVLLFVAADWFGCAHEAPVPDDALAREQPVFASANDTHAAVAPAAPEWIELRILLVAYARDSETPARADAPKRSRAEALERARTLTEMAKSGEKLSQLVSEYSDRAGAHEDMGVTRMRSDASQPPAAALVQAALALPIGGISDPVDQPEGFVVVERLKDPPVGPERIAAKHILIGFAGSPKPIDGATRTEAEAREIAERVAREASAPGADWNALAAQYTDEPGSKTTGGDLGKFGRGQMVPAFEKAAFALKVGETSEVVKSPFGFHVIRRYE